MSPLTKRIVIDVLESQKHFYKNLFAAKSKSEPRDSTQNYTKLQSFTSPVSKQTQGQIETYCWDRR